MATTRRALRSTNVPLVSPLKTPVRTKKAAKRALSDPESERKVEKEADVLIPTIEEEEHRASSSSAQNDAESTPSREPSHASTSEDVSVSPRPSETATAFEAIISESQSVSRPELLPSTTLNTPVRTPISNYRTPSTHNRGTKRAREADEQEEAEMEEARPSRKVRVSDPEDEQENVPETSDFTMDDAYRKALETHASASATPVNGLTASRVDASEQSSPSITRTPTVLNTLVNVAPSARITNGNQNSHPSERTPTSLSTPMKGRGSSGITNGALSSYASRRTSGSISTPVTARNSAAANTYQPPNSIARSSESANETPLPPTSKSQESATPTASKTDTLSRNIFSSASKSTSKHTFRKIDHGPNQYSRESYSLTDDEGNESYEEDEGAAPMTSAKLKGIKSFIKTKSKPTTAPGPVTPKPVENPENLGLLKSSKQKSILKSKPSSSSTINTSSTTPNNPLLFFARTSSQPEMALTDPTLIETLRAVVEWTSREEGNKLPSAQEIIKFLDKSKSKGSTSARVVPNTPTNSFSVPDDTDSDSDETDVDMDDDEPTTKVALDDHSNDTTDVSMADHREDTTVVASLNRFDKPSSATQRAASRSPAATPQTPIRTASLLATIDSPVPSAPTGWIQSAKKALSFSFFGSAKKAESTTTPAESAAPATEFVASTSANPPPAEFLFSHPQKMTATPRRTVRFEESPSLKRSLPRLPSEVLSNTFTTPSRKKSTAGPNTEQGPRRQVDYLNDRRIPKAVRDRARADQKKREEQLSLAARANEFHNLSDEYKKEWRIEEEGIILAADHFRPGSSTYAVPDDSSSDEEVEAENSGPAPVPSPEPRDSPEYVPPPSPKKLVIEEPDKRFDDGTNDDCWFTCLNRRCKERGYSCYGLRWNRLDWLEVNPNSFIGHRPMPKNPGGGPRERMLHQYTGPAGAREWQLEWATYYDLLELMNRSFRPTTQEQIDEYEHMRAVHRENKKARAAADAAGIVVEDGYRSNVLQSRDNTQAPPPPPRPSNAQLPGSASASSSATPNPAVSKLMKHAPKTPSRLRDVERAYSSPLEQENLPEDGALKGVSAEVLDMVKGHDVPAAFMPEPQNRDVIDLDPNVAAFARIRGWIK